MIWGLVYPVYLVAPVICCLLAVSGVQYAEAQDNIIYTNYTDEELSFEYPEGWIVDEENRFRLGPEVVMYPSDEFQSLTMFKHPIPSASLRSVAEEWLEAAQVDMTDLDTERRLVEDIAFNELVIDNETAATFLIVSYDRNTNETTEANKYAITKHNDQVYMFVYTSYPWDFGTPENMAIRENFLNSIKWAES